MRAKNPKVALATVIAEGLLGRLAFGIVSFAFPLYAFAIGLSLAQIGLLVSLRTVIAMALKPGAGILADRIGVRNVYMLGSLARVIAAGALIFTGGFIGLAAIRTLQGISAAGRDVASLSVIARDAQKRIGSVYSWYATAKHVGGVAGAALAGVLIGFSGGDYRLAFGVAFGLSLLPLAAAWYGLRETEDTPARQKAAEREQREEAKAVIQPGFLATLRSLQGPALVATLVSTSAYMVHGLFPILATEHAGLTEAQTGIIYSLSAALFLVIGPGFGWLIDRYGAMTGLGWRSIANIGSSVLYVFSPTFIGLAGAKTLDDSGKAAFRPAWAAAISRIAEDDPPRRSQRLGTLDTSQSAGEVIGPLLAGLLWASGGVVALFGVRILIAGIAEVAAWRVFRHLHGPAGSGNEADQNMAQPQPIGIVRQRIIRPHRSIGNRRSGAR